MIIRCLFIRRSTPAFLRNRITKYVPGRLSKQPSGHSFYGVVDATPVKLYDALNSFSIVPFLYVAAT